MRLYPLLIVCLIWPVAVQAGQKNSCDGVDRRMPKHPEYIAQRIAKQFHESHDDLLQSFKFENWSIYYVDCNCADESFVFYRGNPLHTNYVTTWGGAAAYFEENEIRKWILKNAPGIPPHLAACFAWHVTKDRDM